jgi:2-desacetyl-2-hydroxyethyl bacteriochlorophyllide A dehydrogenase
MNVLTCVTPHSFEYQQRPLPELTPGHTILKIKRIGVCGTDLHAFEGTQPYFSYPRILGHELAGEIVASDGAPGFAPGETVTCIPYFHCQTCFACRTGKPNCCERINVFGVHSDGGMSEYVSVPSYALVQGEGLDASTLALAEPLAIGAHGVRRAGVVPGEFVLVIGAGPIGLGTMEFARIAGAQVIALDINDSRLKFCRDVLKIPHTIHSAVDDPIKRLLDITHGDMPAVVIDATGNLNAIQQGFRYIAHGGRYVLIGLQKGEVCFSHPDFHKRESTLMSSRNATRQDFEQVIQALTQKKVDPSTYITHRVSFHDVAARFPSWLNPATGVIKAMIEL